MLALGIILVLLAAAAVIAALFGGAGQSATFDLSVIEIHTNTLGVFMIGAFTVIVLVLGLALIAAGMRRVRRRRQDKKQLNRLSKKLEAQETQTSTSTGTTSGTTGTTGTSEATAEQTRTDTSVTDRDRQNP
jgi:membrane protein implicated in regulation of membrane protease activity